MEKQLKDTYFNIKNQASFGGVERLARETNIPRSKVKKWLATQDVYTLHKPRRINFERRKVLSYHIGDLLQCDLVDMSKFSKYNKGVKFLLTTIDVFSKYAVVLPLKNKSSVAVSEAFQKLFRRMKPSRNLQTDKGTEFYNKKVQGLFKKYKINHYSSQSEFKASVIERFNKTLKGKLFRIFTWRNSYKYIDILEKVVESYNASIHRSTGFAPVNVHPGVENIIFKRLYGREISPLYRYQPGEQVRISKLKGVFSKGYLPQWSEEVFLIDKRYATRPPTYVIKDLKGHAIKGRFYENELQKVVKKQSDFWRVEKILKTRGVGKNKEYFVKWKGFNNTFNSWTKASWMK